MAVNLLFDVWRIYFGLLGINLISIASAVQRFSGILI